MAKSTVKSQILSQVASLLDKFSDRLTDISRETRQNTDSIASLYDQVRIKVGGLEGKVIDQTAKNGQLVFRDEQLRGKLNELGQEFNKFKKEVEDREARQTLRDQNNVQALYNFRDSTSKAFAQVKTDVDSLLKITQKLNERVGQADSKAEIAMAGAVRKAQDGLPSDHVWLNKKLTGVYDSLEEQEARIQILEKVQSLYEALRKAQNDFAVANGAFLAGPRS